MKIMNKILYWTIKILIISAGAFLIVFGERDDSPGAQGLGLLLVIASVASVVVGRKKLSLKKD